MPCINSSDHGILPKHVAWRQSLIFDIRIDDTHAYVEVSVFGQYDKERLGDIFDAMRGVVSRHGFVSELEIHHGHVTNALAVTLNLKNYASGKTKDYDFLSKIRRYALVADNPGWPLRFFIAMGGKNFRIFPSHELDKARQWIEEAHMMPDTAKAKATP